MPELRSDDFAQFFFELHQFTPFPWQERLARVVISGGWPTVIDVPTASGKTACIDIALFALAVLQREAPRRIFFVLDRRVIVNEAFERAKKIKVKLEEGTSGIVGLVASRLREVAEGPCPLKAVELRGGIYRDMSWVRDPLQPTVAVSTVDQVGSRLLFRGYGESQNIWPIHAGLIANDALIFLDEAHCSRAFAETLKAVGRYRSEAWKQEPEQSPFGCVEMTATPSQASPDCFRITREDRAHEKLGKRIFTAKPTRLVSSKSRAPDREQVLDELAKTMVEQIEKLAEQAGGVRGAAVIVNRVATARKVYERLEGKNRILMIGRMRPLDRDDLLMKLQPLKSGASRVEGEPPIFVVATQCLEVGADLDFDVMVSECASVDALQQRFGRLDRLGEFEGARGCIVVESGQASGKKPDPIYDNALPLTWQWLEKLAGADKQVNMGVESRNGAAQTIAEHLKQLPDEQANEFRRVGEHAPVLLPSHLDALAQTFPKPCPEPDIALFLHGPKTGAPDVQVAWRADLDGVERGAWSDIVALFPPTSAECMPVPIYEFQKWLADASHESDLDANDLESSNEGAPESRSLREGRAVLRWTGDSSDWINDPKKVRPGDTLVVPAKYGGWDQLGHKPEGSKPDLAERAYFQMRQKVRLRLHPNVLPGSSDDNSGRSSLLQKLTPDLIIDDEFCECLKAYRDELDVDEWFRGFLDIIVNQKQRSLRLTPLPEAAGRGWLLESRTRVIEDSGDDESSSGKEVSLADHTKDVRDAVQRNVACLGSPAFRSTFDCAAMWHDAGKVDMRFQALLLSGDMMAAHFAPRPLAKGEGPGGVKGLWQRCGLPDGFRHETLSLQFAERTKLVEGVDRDLALHLIATHHGRCRPFPPVVIADELAEDVCWEHCTVTRSDRVERAPHRLDSGVAERYWSLTRRHGWWGLAWFEALFRLGDWEASRKEARGEE